MDPLGSSSSSSSSAKMATNSSKVLELNEKTSKMQQKLANQRSSFLGAVQNRQEQMEVLLEELSKAARLQERMQAQIDLAQKRNGLLLEELRLRSEKLDFREKQRLEAQGLVENMLASADLHTRHTVNTVIGIMQQKVKGHKVGDGIQFLDFVRSRLHSALGTLRRRLLHSTEGEIALKYPFRAWLAVVRKRTRRRRVLKYQIGQINARLLRMGYIAFALGRNRGNTRFVQCLATNMRNHRMVRCAFLAWNIFRLERGYAAAIVENSQVRTKTESAQSEREMLYEALREKDQQLAEKETQIATQARTIDRASSMQDYSLQEMENQLEELRSVVVSQDQSLNDLHRRLRTTEQEKAELRVTVEQLLLQQQHDASVKAKVAKTNEQFMTVFEELEHKRSEVDFIKSQLERAHAATAEERRVHAENLSQKNAQITELQRKLSDVQESSSTMLLRMDERTPVDESPGLTPIRALPSQNPRRNVTFATPEDVMTSSSSMSSPSNPSPIQPTTTAAAASLLLATEVPVRRSSTFLDEFGSSDIANIRKELQRIRINFLDKEIKESRHQS